MIREGGKCIHVVPMSKMNSGAGCYCKRFISGAPGTCLRVVFLFVSPASETFAGEKDTSIVGEISFHFEKAFGQTHHLLGIKWQGFRGWRSVLKKLLLKRSLITVSTFYSLSVHLSGFYLSLCTVYLISFTKPITAMFLQPLQLDSGSYWPFTRLLYNTRNH